MNDDSNAGDPVARAARLVRLFCSTEEFGDIRRVSRSQVPEPAKTLLDHRSHMTVAMEQHHGCEVRLRVVAQADDSRQTVRSEHAAGRDDSSDHWYAREILLETPAGRIVQHGIVRIDLTHLDPATARAIREGRRPLGRILIEAGMLRDVHGVELLEILPGPHLRAVLQLPPHSAAGKRSGPPVYGRVAEIQLDGREAVELLEIVAPAP